MRSVHGMETAMKKIYALTGGLLALSSFASAQFTSEMGDMTPYGWSLRAGTVLPLDANFRSVSKYFTSIGIDYPLNFRLMRNAETYLSFDWVTKSFKGNKNQMFPINLNQRFYFGEGEDGHRTYGFVGVGVVVFNFTTSQTKLGGRVGLGMQLDEKWFGEASLMFSDKLDNTSIKATAVGFHLGYRF